MESKQYTNVTTQRSSKNHTVGVTGRSNFTLKGNQAKIANTNMMMYRTAARRQENQVFGIGPGAASTCDSLFAQFRNACLKGLLGLALRESLLD